MASPPVRVPRDGRSWTLGLTEQSLQNVSTERPSSQHRLSSSMTPSSSMPTRQANHKQHSHSVSLGTFNPDHRVTRRKSINTNAVNVSAVRAALGEQEEGTTSRSSHRRSLNAREKSNHRGHESEARPHTAGHKPEHYGLHPSHEESALAAEPPSGQSANGTSKSRARRASEGAQLGGKRVSSELKCEQCGKGYKHSSCLTKHLWEHTPEWALTSKLLISKHQQVQLLEAASVLVGMNLDEPILPDTAKTVDSDDSSASPAASGSSDLRDDDEYSSAETTPPPMNDQYGMMEGEYIGRHSKRYSGNSSSISRSYQSAPSNSLPGSGGFAGLGQYGSQYRPSTAGLGSMADDEDEAGLVAAVQSLCSFNTPRTGAVLLPADVPPVPPLPARFAEQSYPTAIPRSGADDSERRSKRVSALRLADAPTGKEWTSRRRHVREKSDEYDEGVFGGMEGLAQETHETLHFSGSAPQ